MAVAENAGVKVDSSGQNLDNNNTASSATETNPSCPDDQSPKSDSSLDSSSDPPDSDDRTNETVQKGQTANGVKSEIKNLSDAFSKLNPMAKEFVPPSLARSQSGVSRNGLGFTNSFAAQPLVADGSGQFARRVFIYKVLTFCVCLLV